MALLNPPLANLPQPPNRPRLQAQRSMFNHHHGLALLRTTLSDLTVYFCLGLRLRVSLSQLIFVYGDQLPHSFLSLFPWGFIIPHGKNYPSLKYMFCF